MQVSIEEKRSPDQDMYSEAQMSQEFVKLNRISENDDVESEEYYYGALDNQLDDDDEEEEEEEEFSFVCGVENKSPIAAEDAFADGQIKPVFPLFDRDLLSHGGDSEYLHQNLPSRPPVKKVFVETVDDQATSSAAAGNDDEIVGPYCEWSSKKVVEASPEVCKKSNSTGFSKIWRLREFVGRSHSDGRDAFVFLNNGQAAPPPPAVKAEEKVEKTESTVKKVRKVKKKSKTASLSAHEVYLRSKAKEDERRRSYLPYRPELVGFFTSVNGGLTKNVHPY